MWEDKKFLSGKVNNKLYFVVMHILIDTESLLCSDCCLSPPVPALLSPQSFYLPGSIDANDKQMEQWNITTPPLYLWSRPDWTVKHKGIAKEHGHLFSQHEVSNMESPDNEEAPASHTMDDKDGDDVMLGHDSLRLTDDEDHTSSMNGGQKGSSALGSTDRQSQWVSKADSDKSSWKRKRTEENDGRAVTSPAKRQAINQMHEEELDHSISHPIDRGPSVEGFQPKSYLLPPYSEAGDSGYGHLEPSSFGVAYVGTQKYLRESEMRQQSGLYGLQNPDSMRNDYLSGHDPAYNLGSSYLPPGSVSEPPYMMTAPAMQRYAPRLDELNHVSRVDPLRPEPPIIGRIGASEHTLPQPGNGNGLPGFATGSHQFYSRRNSSGRFNR